MGILQNFQKFRVRVWKCYRTHRSSRYCGTGVNNSQKFRAGAKHAVPVPRGVWNGSYITYRSSGYGYESLTELPEVPGIVVRAYRTYGSSGQVWKCCTRTPCICGTGVQNLPKFRVRVWISYRIYRGSAYGKTQVNMWPRGRSSFWSGGFHRACMTCSH